MAEQLTKPRLILFFTWDVSLALWQEKGLLQREVRLYQELAARGVDITFLSWGGEEEKTIADSLFPAIKTVSLYNHIARPNNKALRALCSLWAPLAIYSIIKQGDILKTNQLWGGWVAVIAKLIARKPMIARCGFELYDFSIKQGHGKARLWFVKLISRMTYGVADRICVATAEDKDFVIKVFRQSADKISIHPNWIDTGVFIPQSREKKKDTILFVGRLSAQKNLELLIDALAGTNYTLDIAGDGELRASLEKRAREKGVPVHFLGSVANDKLPEIYNSYNVFILPSHYEGNPKTLLEAMACGCAVIGTNVPGIASVIQHSKSGLLSPANDKSLRDVIVQLMSDTDLQLRLGRGARDQIVKNQALDRLVARELACYRKLIRQ